MRRYQFPHQFSSGVVKPGFMTAAMKILLSGLAQLLDSDFEAK
jgi:hypothetical protein